MSLEITCEDCGGRMKVIEPGSVVSCPHCGTHVTSPAEAGDSVSVGPDSAIVSHDSPGGESASGPAFPGLPAGTDEAAVGFPEAADGPVAGPAFASFEPAESAADGFPSRPAEAEFQGTGPSPPAPDHAVEAEAPAERAAGGRGPDRLLTVCGVPAVLPHPAPAEGSTSVPDPSAADRMPLTSGGASDRGRGVSRGWFVLVLSYASAVSLALALVIWRSSGVDPHVLENLPDLKPPQKGGQIALQLAPEKASLPAGHTLRLGEERRFGNVIVSPRKVTRGPLEFVHFSGDESRSREPTGDVLKLWLEFENVSEDQVFAPLDRELLFSRTLEEGTGRLRANNFVCRLEDKDGGGQKVMLYDLPQTSEWELRGQNLGRKLRPGERRAIYIPTSEKGLDALEGKLVWRVHFRKGYHPESRRGVTTLIEVVFSSEAIRPEGRGEGNAAQ